MNLKASWRNQLWPLRILRIWLGATWIYAGWDKASDPGFLTTGSATFIGTQLSAYSVSSPVGFLIDAMLEHSVQIGIFVMLAEFAIGAATLLWIAPTWAAFGGFAMSLSLWLASSWNVKPYFLASDSAYAVLWLTYFLFLYGARSKRKLPLDRRGFFRISLVAGTAIVGASVGKLFSQVSSSAAALPAKKIAKDAAIKVGAVQKFTSRAGTPAVLFRTKTGIFAYSAVCTHQGCTVEFNPASKYLQCGCHGAAFDPFNGAKVMEGPANTPLPTLKVALEGSWIVEI
ncbi:MAG: Rieske 2Fe-2S domain-containing protein [Candidatus Planktophila sp.]|jgi:thiosulfate dehydrogenase (quinone) large subunit|tara:strand:- start:1189 stop:2046 length:858 start_codon:yes stop_codon:yes gene_type:complete